MYTTGYVAVCKSLHWTHSVGHPHVPFYRRQTCMCGACALGVECLLRLAPNFMHGWGGGVELMSTDAARGCAERTCFQTRSGTCFVLALRDDCEVARCSFSTKFRSSGVVARPSAAAMLRSCTSEDKQDHSYGVPVLPPYFLNFCAWSTLFPAPGDRI